MCPARCGGLSPPRNESAAAADPGSASTATCGMAGRVARAAAVLHWRASRAADSGRQPCASCAAQQDRSARASRRAVTQRSGARDDPVHAQSAPRPRRLARTTRLRRRAYIAKELKRLAPDVIGLQEVIERCGSVENQAAWLARKLGDDCTFASVDPVGAPKRDGNALRIQRYCAYPCRRLNICTPASHTPAMLPKLVSRNVSTTRETRLRYQPRSVCASSRSDRKSP